MGPVASYLVAVPPASAVGLHVKHVALPITLGLQLDPAARGKVHGLVEIGARVSKS